MTRRIGVFSAEGGTEGVHIAECHGKGFGRELSADGQVGFFAEEVLGKVDRAVLLFRQTLEKLEKLSYNNE